MATKCPECSNKFKIQETLCDDWRDPNKSFGCPHCGTFFVKDMRPKHKSSLVSSLFMAGIFLPATNILFRQLYHGGDAAVTLHASFIVFFCLVVTLLSLPNPLLAPLKKSPYNQSSKSDDESTVS
jgi:hypothetical protein